MVGIFRFPPNRNSVHGDRILVGLLLLVLRVEAQCNEGQLNGGEKCEDDSIRLIGKVPTTMETPTGSSPDPQPEDQAGKEDIGTSGSVAVAVLFIALFNFSFCCCCWCCCRVLDSLNHPLSHRGRLGNRGNIGFPVAQQLMNPAQVELHAMGHQENHPPVPKATRNVVIVNPGGHIEIGVPDD